MRGCHAGCSPPVIRTSQHEPASHRFATTNASPETSISPRPTRSRFAPSIRLNQVERPRAVSAPVAPPPSRLSRCLLRSSQFARPTASRHRTPAAKPKPSAIPTSPDRCVRARLRCSSRASLPLTRQAGTPTAIIGMRPATSLRTKAMLVFYDFRLRFGYVSPHLPGSLPLCVLCLKTKSMRHSTQSGRAPGRWQRVVGARCQALQQRAVTLYFQRVTFPVYFWVAAGRPPQFRPQLPWWQPLLWRWLCLSGQARLFSSYRLHLS